MKKFTEIAAPYIAMGWKVFPIRYGTKDRYFAKTDMPDLPQAGFYWGTDDPKMIERYEHELPGGPRHNIAVRTGAASGIVVIDLDFGKGPEAERALTELAAQGKRFPATPGEALTPSGGAHWYYQYRGPLSCSQSKLGTHIDIKADGGLTILPPSIRRDKGGAAYEWVNAPFGQTLPMLPKWVMDELAPKPAPPRIMRPRYASAHDNSDPSRFEWRLREIANAPDGDRNGTLYRMYRGCLRYGHTPAQVADQFIRAALDAGLPMSRIEPTMKSVENRMNREGGL